MKRVKTKIVTVVGLLIASLALVAIAILLSPSLPPRAWSVGVPQWKSSEEVAIITYASQHGVQKGDSFSYFVQVWYDREVVEEIDKASVDKGVSLAPFEVRNVTEREFNADSAMRVYQREYEIQLIDGEVDRVYDFPTIVVRYKPRGSAGLLNVGADAEPVFVAARLPAEIGDLELRPVAPTVNDLAQRTLPWVLWGMGAVLAALGTADLLLRVAPQWRSARRRARAPWEGNAIAEAYRAVSGRFIWSRRG